MDSKRLSEKMRRAMSSVPMSDGERFRLQLLMEATWTPDKETRKHYTTKFWNQLFESAIGIS